MPSRRTSGRLAIDVRWPWRGHGPGRSVEPDAPRATALGGRAWRAWTRGGASPTRLHPGQRRRSVPRTAVLPCAPAAGCFVRRPAYAAVPWAGRLTGGRGQERAAVACSGPSWPRTWAVRAPSGPGGSPGVHGSEGAQFEFACRRCPARGKSQAERGEILVGRTCGRPSNRFVHIFLTGMAACADQTSW